MTRTPLSSPWQLCYPGGIDDGMTIAKKALHIALILLVALALVAAVLVGIRTWNKFSWEDTDLPQEPPAVAGVSIKEFSQGYARGYHLQPKNQTRDGSIVLFGGPEGSVAPAMASALAKEGFEVFALHYFGQPDQHEFLENVPLELFEDITDELSQPITVMGISTGAELALLMSTYFSEVDNAVAINPSAHHWQGIGTTFPGAPSFTLNGRELPYLKMDEGSQTLNLVLARPVTYRDAYASALERAPEGSREEARIKVENSQARLFIAAGGQDKFWDSESAAKEIERFAGDRAEVHLYPDAGNVLTPSATFQGLNLGGSEEANREMSNDVMEKLLEWLP